MKLSLAAINLFVLFTLLVGGLQAVEVAEANSKIITVPDDYPTIQAAINNAANGDTILIKKGVYVEDPVVNRSISLVGENRDAPVIDVTQGLSVQSDNVTITNLTIYNGLRGIGVFADNCICTGNKIFDATYGIELYGSVNNFVAQNYIELCSQGIWVCSTSNSTFTENTITSCSDIAIRLLNANDNIITKNNITYSDNGITIYGANKNEISNNNFIQNIVQVCANEDYRLSFGGNRSKNKISDNFWSDYKGTDANGDGKGDSPYIIDAYNQDNNPLMEPIDFTEPSNPIPTPNPTVALPTATPTTLPTPRPSLTARPSPQATPSTTLTASPTQPIVIGHGSDDLTYKVTSTLIGIIAIIIVAVIGVIAYFKKIRK